MLTAKEARVKASEVKKLTVREEEELEWEYLSNMIDGAAGEGKNYICTGLISPNVEIRLKQIGYRVTFAVDHITGTCISW